MDKRPVPAEDTPATMTIWDVARELRLKSDSGVRRLIADGDAPEPDFYLGRKPRWIRARFEAWMARRADEYAAAVEERLATDDPVGAQNELAKLERAAGARGRNAS